jgi:transcriptional regulator with XRE-family HTH domain
VKRDRPSPVRQLVARNVRRLRDERELSQEELAHRADLHRTNISKIERGLQAVSVDNLHWIAKALGVEAAELLKR